MRALRRSGARPRPLPTDEDLVRSFSSGNREALDEIVQRYKDAMYQLACWYVGPAAAEDVTQEIFVQLVGSVADFAERSTFRTWFHALARHVCFRHLRHRRTRERWIRTDESQVIQIADPGDDVLTRLQRNENHSLVRHALDALSPAAREALLLRHWQLLSYEEMAEALDVPVGTVRSRLHNARAALANQLATLAEGNPHEL